jgi:hypothetical protein
LRAKKLGWETIDCIEFNGDEREARLWEISESLHRAELSVQEHADQTAEWIRLYEEKTAQSAHVASIESKRKDRKGHRKESGINAAARELGSIGARLSAPSRSPRFLRKRMQSARLAIASVPADHQVMKVEELKASTAERARITDNIIAMPFRGAVQERAETSTQLDEQEDADGECEHEARMNGPRFC